MLGIKDGRALRTFRQSFFETYRNFVDTLHPYNGWAGAIRSLQEYSHETSDVATYSISPPPSEDGLVKMFPHPKSEPDPIPLVDNLFAPEILAMGLSGLSMMSGIVTLTLESGRCDHSKPNVGMERFVVGRLSLPIPAAQALLTGLHQFLGHHGLNPLEPVTCQ